MREKGRERKTDVEALGSWLAHAALDKVRFRKFRLFLVRERGNCVRLSGLGEFSPARGFDEF